MHKPYILIAEDDADDRFLLETAFSESGFRDQLVFVENGIELIDHLEKGKSKNGMDKKFPMFTLFQLL